MSGTFPAVHLTLRETGRETCQYCGSTTKVERRIRTLEPVIPQEPPPELSRDPLKAYDEWGTERLVAGIMRHDEPVDERVAMARALDEWFHVNDEMASYVFALWDTPISLPRCSGSSMTVPQRPRFSFRC